MRHPTSTATLASSVLIVTVSCVAPAKDVSHTSSVSPTASAPTAVMAVKVVRGRVLDHAGNPLSEGWARVIGPGNTVEAETKVDAHGSFSLPLDDSRRVR